MVGRVLFRFWARGQLLLEEGGNPEDDDSTYDGCAKLSEDAAPLNAQHGEEPAAQGSAKETQNEVHDEAEATTFHQLASAEASETSNNKRKNNTHNSIMFSYDGAKIVQIGENAK